MYSFNSVTNLWNNCEYFRSFVLWKLKCFDSKIGFKPSGFNRTSYSYCFKQGVFRYQRECEREWGVLSIITLNGQLILLQFYITNFLNISITSQSISGTPQHSYHSNALPLRFNLLASSVCLMKLITPPNSPSGTSNICYSFLFYKFPLFYYYLTFDSVGTQCFIYCSVSWMHFGISINDVVSRHSFCTADADFRVCRNLIGLNSLDSRRFNLNIYYYLWFTNYYFDHHQYVVSKVKYIENQSRNFVIASIKGARGGKKSTAKLSTHFNIILTGKKLEIIELSDPSPIKLSKMVATLLKIPKKQFGMFFIIFLPFIFIRLKKLFLSYIISRTSAGLYRLMSRSLLSSITSSEVSTLLFFMYSLISQTLVQQNQLKASSLMVQTIAITSARSILFLIVLEKRVYRYEQRNSEEQETMVSSLSSYSASSLAMILSFWIFYSSVRNSMTRQLLFKLNYLSLLFHRNPNIFLFLILQLLYIIVLYYSHNGAILPTMLSNKLIFLNFQYFVKNFILFHYKFLTLTISYSLPIFILILLFLFCFFYLLLFIFPLLFLTLLLFLSYKYQIQC